MQLRLSQQTISRARSKQVGETFGFRLSCASKKTMARRPPPRREFVPGAGQPFDPAQQHAPEYQAGFIPPQQGYPVPQGYLPAMPQPSVPVMVAQGFPSMDPYSGQPGAFAMQPVAHQGLPVAIMPGLPAPPAMSSVPRALQAFAARQRQSAPLSQGMAVHPDCFPEAARPRPMLVSMGPWPGMDAPRAQAGAYPSPLHPDSARGATASAGVPESVRVVGRSTRPFQPRGATA